MEDRSEEVVNNNQEIIVVVSKENIYREEWKEIEYVINKTLRQYANGKYENVTARLLGLPQGKNFRA